MGSYVPRLPPERVERLRRWHDEASVALHRLAARGLLNKDISARLVITPKTVGNHLEHIYTRIGVSNRAGAALFAMRRGLLPEDHSQ